MQNKRFDELEGLRGVAAVIVVFYHFLLAFYLFAFLGPGQVQTRGFEDNLYGNPIMVFLSGTFAVAIFFVLSGFVLSIGFFQTGKMEIIRKLAAKRYLRLMLPALAATLICFVIIKLGISQLHTVAGITQSSWLAGTWLFNPDIFSALKSGIYDIFMVSGSSFNNVLWTMAYEFAGSFLVFGFIALFGKQKHRWLGYVIISIVTFNTWFLAFVAGMVIADLYANGKLKSSTRNLWYVLPFLAGSLFLAGFPLGSTEGTIYQYLTLSAFDIQWNAMYLTVGAIGVMMVILGTDQIGKLFRLKAVKVLGKYTFSMYLVHLIVLYTFAMAVFLFFNSNLGMSFNRSVLLTLAASLPVIALASYFFEKYIDRPSTHLASYAGNIFLGHISAEDIKVRIQTACRKYNKRIFSAYPKIMRRPVEEVEAEL